MELNINQIHLADMELRGYQVYLAAAAVRDSTLVVLDTGLGKTFIAALALADILERKGGRALFLAPTKPLVTQHYKDFQEYFPQHNVEMITGSLSHKKRLTIWQSNSKIIIATPQTVMTHLLDESFDLSDVSVIVYDEAHKATGNYDYVNINRIYNQQRGNTHTIGLTASPGSDRKKVEQICEDLGFSRIEIKTRYDWDVKEYTYDVELKTITVRMPEYVKPIHSLLKEMMFSHIDKINRMGFPIRKTEALRQEEISRIQRIVDAKLARGEGRSNPRLYQVKSEIAAVMSLRKAIEYATTQGLTTLYEFLSGMDSGPSAKKYHKMITSDHRYVRVMRMVENNMNFTLTAHPKFRKAAELLRKYVVEGGTKAILFTNYRSTCERLVETLNRIDGINAIEFIGQANRGTQKGMTQKKQAEVISQFKDGKYNVLVATSVAEEGLDIPATDLIIFYEPVPSAIRYIQRRGRTGRHRAGKVLLLVTENSVDETFLWSSRKKEKKMRAELNILKKELARINLFWGDMGKYYIKRKENIIYVYLDNEGLDHDRTSQKHKDSVVPDRKTVVRSINSKSQPTLFDFSDQKKTP